MYHYLLYPEYLNIMQIKLQIPLSKPETGEGVQAESTETDGESDMDLRRRMSKDFKAIKNSCIPDQVLPETDLVERFYRDSKTMYTYPSKGKD